MLRRRARERSLRPLSRARTKRSVLETLADFIDIVLGHKLRACVEVRGRDVAIELQIELHDRVEALQEGLLSEGALQRAGLDLLELLRAEVEAIGADLVVELELRDGVADCGRHSAVRSEKSDHVLAALDQLYDRGGGDVGADIDADVVGPRVDLEILQA